MYKPCFNTSYTKLNLTFCEGGDADLQKTANNIQLFY